MDALVLGGQVAAARADLLRKALSCPRRHVTTAPGLNRESLHVEPVADRAGRLQQEELAADRVDCDLDRGRRCRRLPPRDRARSRAARRCDTRRDAVLRAPCRRRAERSPSPGPASFFRLVTGIPPVATTRSGRPEFVRSTNESPQPAKSVPSAGSKSGRALENEDAVVLANAADGSWRELVTNRSSGPLFGAVDGDAHAGVRIRHPRCRGAVLEAEAEPRRVGLRSARPRDVDVELVRILVVRDVEVGTAVAVDVEEGRAEAVREAGRLETCLRPRLRGSARDRSGRFLRSG